jgi:hypothetical protein
MIFNKELTRKVSNLESKLQFANCENGRSLRELQCHISELKCDMVYHKKITDLLLEYLNLTIETVPPTSRTYSLKKTKGA